METQLKTQSFDPGDTLDTPQFVSLGFGARDSSTVKTSGSLESQATTIVQSEQDDAISSANATDLTAGNVVTASGFIGDGPNGSEGNGTGDFDFYAITAEAGQIITVNTETDDPRGGLDTIVGLYDSDGNRLTLDNDASSLDGFLNSRLTFTAPTAGPYFVAVGGKPLPCQSIRSTPTPCITGRSTDAGYRPRRRDRRELRHQYRPIGGSDAHYRSRG